MEAQVQFNEEAYLKFKDYLLKRDFSKIFILVDNNTHEYCLPVFLKNFKGFPEYEIIEIEAGEENKNIGTCSEVWNILSELGADRKSLFLNLGGGVITDLGGFIALCFKRGISYVNFPTTLLAMVDASIGGKTGVNLGNLKNQIGVIKPADLVGIDSTFLRTLEAAEIRSGLAEMLKHGLIKDENYWNKLISLESYTGDDLKDLIQESIEIKEEIVAQDPLERNLRKSLNFGHTLGHALESFFLQDPAKKKILHGEAVAAGMVMEAYLSMELLSLPEEKLRVIKENIITIFGKIMVEEQEIAQIITYLKFDKKNEKGNIYFVLLEGIGQPVINCLVPEKLIRDAFNFYLN